MLIIGLTGNLGHVVKQQLLPCLPKGSKIIDADAITRGLLAPGRKCVKKVAKSFPGVILN